MPSLADREELVGFFSYAREDDADSDGALSALRDRIQRGLRGVLGRSPTTFRLWQDSEAIAPGTLWRSEIDAAIAQSVFFIPIVTPTAITSQYCRTEFEAFLSREQILRRNDLIFPILYIPISGLRDSIREHDDPVLSIIAARQYINWLNLKHFDITDTRVRIAIDGLCHRIAQTLRRPVALENAKITSDPPQASRPPETSIPSSRLRGSIPSAGPLRESDKRRLLDDRSVSVRVERDGIPWSLVLWLFWPIVAICFGLWSVGLINIPNPHFDWVRWTPAPLPAVGQSFRDCSSCSEMVVVPPGEFMMGTETSEEGSEDNERPKHKVTIKSVFAVGKYHVTREEYATFSRVTNRKVEPNCYNTMLGQKGKSWVDPSFTQTDRDPVVCVSWTDAKAYVLWLSQGTGKTYQLLTEAEWEYAARAGTTSARYWGEAPGNGNADCSGCGSAWDGRGTSPSGSFASNAFGLYDMLGNALQWTEDCFNKDYNGAPTDGSAWTSGDCGGRMLRGGAWNYYARALRTGFRTYTYFGNNLAVAGFRVARKQ